MAFYSPVILQSRHETLYPTHFLLKNSLYSLFFLFLQEQSDRCLKYVFFHPLCSGQRAQAMFIRLKVSHRDMGRRERNAKHKAGKHITATGTGLSVLLLQIETKSLWKARGERGEVGFASDLSRSCVVQHL